MHPLVKLVLLSCGADAHRIRSHSAPAEPLDLTAAATLREIAGVHLADELGWTGFMWYQTVHGGSKLWITVDRHGNQSLFEQSRKQLWSENPKKPHMPVWFTDWSSYRRLRVQFKGESGIDQGGLAREWLQLVLQSIVLPETRQRQGLRCVTLGECSEAPSPQYLLQALPTGNVIPIMGWKHEQSTWDLNHTNLLRLWTRTAHDMASDIKAEVDQKGYLQTGVSKLYGLTKDELTQTAEEGLLNLWTSRAGAVISHAKREAGREALLSYWLSSAYDVVMGINRDTRTLPQEALKRYNFLGQWLARAYVISKEGFSPVGFHPLIYESIYHGRVQPPEFLPWPRHYRWDDTIQECEWLATVFGRRSPQELESYGWTSCDELKDPATGKYVDENCFKPLYRDRSMWEDVLFTEWGAFAPLGVNETDMVPFDQAKEYTRLLCQHTWEKGFVDPVREIVDGFRATISSRSFWSKLNSADDLKDLVEGSPEINLPSLLDALGYPGFTEAEKQTMIQTLEDLRQKGEGLPPMERPLNKLVRFFTGSFKDPVGGWKAASPQFVARPADRCEPLHGHTCYNQLHIVKPCLQDAAKLEEMILESIASEEFGFA